MIDLKSLEYALASSMAPTLVVISPRDAEKFAAELRALTRCAPWQSIESMRSNSGGRIVVADVENSFYVTYENTVQFL